MSVGQPRLAVEASRADVALDSCERFVLPASVFVCHFDAEARVRCRDRKLVNAVFLSLLTKMHAQRRRRETSRHCDLVLKIYKTMSNINTDTARGIVLLIVADDNAKPERKRNLKTTWELRNMSNTYKAHETRKREQTVEG